MQTVLTNARLILEDEIVTGTIAFDETGITAVDQGRSSLPSAIDAGGDYVAPGLVEMHTDNMEKHFMPRPKVFWPNGLAAALVHDAQMAAAGVTTVYDAICAGTPFSAKDYRKDIFADVMKALADGRRENVFRIDHRIHMRCELTSPGLLDDIAPYQDDELVQLVSLMDHTPGQRQWRNIEHLKTYAIGNGKTEAEFEADVVVRQEEGAANVSGNWAAVVEMFSSRGIPIATHDDTTVEHVEAGIASGAVISEFPTTVEAAHAAKQRGLATVAGAPNVVRGGSHSGGVSVAELAEKGLLDGLSSDYVPASLLQAVLKLSRDHGVPLPEAMGMVTWKVADILGLKDRGHLKTGLRADLVRFKVLGATPVLAAVWSKGERAFLSGPRYAIYYAPAIESPLWRFGSATLGYDAVTGGDVTFAVPPGCEASSWAERTAEPRRYGFHATLKAPFELAAGRNENQLRAFVHNCAAGLTAVPLAGLTVTALGSFIALTPSSPSEPLQRLAFSLVQAFEPFRAPLSEADLARRLKAPLTPAHRAYLEAYGYPYVGEAFRFHMTLTGSLAQDEVAATRAALASAHAAAVPADPVAIDRIALFRQETRESRFRLLDSFVLG